MLAISEDALKSEQTGLGRDMADPKPKAKRKPRKKASVKKSKPVKSRRGNAKRALKKPTGKGKYSRKCALESCRKPFRTDDPRKRYHSRACGNKFRSKRWFARAAAALRKQTKAAKKGR
jgi:hypothetical protein